MLRKVCLRVEIFKMNFLLLFFLTAKQLLKKSKKRKIKSTAFHEELIFKNLV